MHVIRALHQRLRLAVLIVAVGSACRPTAVPTPVPVQLPPRLVPEPASTTITGGAPFNLTRASTIVVDAGNAEVAAISEMLAAQMRPPTQFPLPVTATAASTGAIVLRLSGAPASVGNEGYTLTVTADSVRLVANSPAGLFHGIQTIRQLLPPDIESEMGSDRSTWQIPAQTIVDSPRFTWRGAMLDVARHFFTVREVEQYVDMLAFYKMNVLHLHLSDDQGWRIALNSRPRLVQLGSLTQVGGGSGGFYTQQDYQDIIRYAAARYILVVPEIDMPSHINAAVIAYPDLACGSRPPGLYTGTDVGWSSLCVDKEVTYAFVEDVVRELSSITPGPYFHIGGDEVQTLTHDQYVKFVERVQGIVNKYTPGSFSGYQLFMNAGSLCAWYFRDSTNNIWDGTGCTLATPACATATPIRRSPCGRCAGGHGRLPTRRTRSWRT